MHASQLTVAPETVRELVDSQFPQWHSLPIKRVGLHGTVNATFRIGDQYAARFPLEVMDIASVRRALEAEAQAARELLGRTRFPTPEPIAIAEPGCGKASTSSTYPAFVRCGRRFVSYRKADPPT